MGIKNGRYRGNRYILTAFAATAILLISAFARADIVTINVQAIVDSVTDPENALGGKIQKDSIITGYYTYDSSVADLHPLDSIIGIYTFSYSLSEPYGIFLNSGGLTFQTGYNEHTDFSISIYDYSSGPSDYFLLCGSGIFPPNDYYVDIVWGLSYPVYTFDNDTLPNSPPNLDNYLDNELRIRNIRYDGSAYLIQSHVISATPEPATILLFSIGILGIWIRKNKF